MDELFPDGWPAFRDKLLDTIQQLLARALPAPFALCKGLLTRAERREVLQWLAPLENLVRSFILFSAMQLPAGRPRPERPADDMAIPVFTIGLPRDGDAPPTFRVMAPEPSRGCGGRLPPIGGGERAKPLDSFQAWPLAQRLQNVLDALDNPEPYMRRLAPRLGRDPSALPKPEKPARPRTMGELAEDFFLAECREMMAQRNAKPDTS